MEKLSNNFSTNEVQQDQQSTVIKADSDNNAYKSQNDNSDLLMQSSGMSAVSGAQGGLGTSSIMMRSDEG